MATSMAASMAMQLEPTSLSMPGAKPPTAGKAAGTAAAGGPDAPADDDASGGDAPPLVMPDDHPLFHVSVTYPASCDMPAIVVQYGWCVHKSDDHGQCRPFAYGRSAALHLRSCEKY